MTNQIINKGFVKKIENINESLSYVTLISDKEQRVPFYSRLKEEIYKGKPVVITLDDSPEMPYSHIKEINSNSKII
ncbi:hypothetical protein HYS72_00620 [Candidatus Pacearchaeota archaeon]|nr:hypothetical protein [Candidatus Pacearchaeota archaeon]MBI2057309.1 hypothetical protein [Candidatus Pacearchaeota archaeon]